MFETQGGTRNRTRDVQKKGSAVTFRRRGQLLCRLTVAWVDCRCFLFLCSSAVPGVGSFLRFTTTVEMVPWALSRDLMPTTCNWNIDMTVLLVRDCQAP